MKRIVVILSILILISCALLTTKSLLNYKNRKNPNTIINQIKKIDEDIKHIKEEINLKNQSYSDGVQDDNKKKELELWQKELRKVKDL